jgi:tyrosyl-tRNA synthetase
MTPLRFYQDLEARGIVKQVSDPRLADVLAQGPITLYIGFDPTSDSLHVGSLLPLLTLRRFQLAGHKVIALAGGATGMIGDPSGKTQERALLDEERIRRNLEGIKAVMARFLDLDPASQNPAIVVNNADWTQPMSFLGFLRDIGKHFTVNHMIAKESVRARLEDREHGISYTEFSYMLLQAFDFFVLNERYGCRLQAGGSDQWGNITAGIELIRRIRASRGEITAGEALPFEKEVFGFTHPLIMKADGTKFGKTERGTVWLDPLRTSPYQFYQFFIQTADADVLPFLRLFTFLPLERIAELEAALKQDPGKREAQLALAREMTRLVHGEKELERVERASQALFGTGIRELDEASLREALADAPSTCLAKNRLAQRIPLVDLLAETGLCNSKGAARKDLQGGGIYLNNDRISDPASSVGPEHLLAGGHLVLRKGKRNYHVLRFE